jgi:hypothetical protein
VRRAGPTGRSRAIKLAAAIAVAASQIATIGCGDSPTGDRESGPTERFFGVNDPMLYAGAQAGQDELSGRHAAAIADAGIGWVRFSTAWRGEEPTLPFQGKHTYDFQFLDRAIAALADQGLPAALDLYTTPVWAPDGVDPAGCGANIRPGPDHIDDFAAYARTVAERYGPRGSFWAENPGVPETPLRSLEIWNEPNWNAYWCPEPDPELYAELFVEAAKAIRTVAPRLRIVTGGLTSVFDDDSGAVDGGMDANVFIERAAKHRPEIAELADAIGFHVYDADVDGVLARISRFRSGLDANGLGDLPIEVNEAGWPTEGSAYPTPEGERAVLISALADTLWASGCNIDGLALYAWRTPEVNTAAVGDFYGVADPDSADPYESGTAYQERIAEVSQSSRPAPSGPC